MEESVQGYKCRKILALISFILLFCFIGLRYETGTDWQSYKKLFDNLIFDWTILVNVVHFDFGYVLLNAFVKLFTDNYSILIFIDAALTGIILYKFIIKFSPRPNISIFLFYTNFMIAQFMGSNRRMIAMVIVLWTFYFVFKNKNIKSWISIVIAFFFHRSSIANVLIYFIPKQLFSWKRIILLLSISIIIGISGLPLRIFEAIGGINSDLALIHSVAIYSSEGEEHLKFGTGNIIYSTILALVKRLCFVGFYLWILKRRRSEDLVPDFCKFCFNAYILAISAYVCLIGTFFQMLTAYWAFVEIVLIGQIMHLATKRQKQTFLCFLIPFGLLQMINALNIFPDLYIPYISIFDNISR
ncbi:EpsG family protein [Duncaniella freteri]|uniref:EpsG family protein n=3 Tax=Duncaniella TaxID=2518495 RepID=UPI0025711F5C|nr:EpsG family protein [Duncaniella freteri]